MSRRSFLKSALAAAGVATVGVGLNKLMNESGEERVVKSIETPEEIDHSSERFDAELLGYKALMTLRKDEVLFVDENNIPIGEPIRFKDYIVHKDAQRNTPRNQILPDGTVAYKLSPGKMSGIGIPEGGIAGEWLQHVRREVQEKYPATKIAETYHSVVDFEKALQEDDEPELIAAIEAGEINTKADIVRYFSDKGVAGSGVKSRAEYVKDEVIFQGDLPDVIADKCRELLPALCAQESKFNAGLTSSSNAKGVMQFKESTWVDEGADPSEIRSLVEQVKVAGGYIPKQYGWIYHFAGDEAMSVLRSKFGDDSSFQEDFEVPMLLNAYNAGAATMGEAAKVYVENVPVEDMPTGKDLFVAVADFAADYNGGKYVKNYRSEAREYVTRIYANADVLEAQGIV